jgi:hypothetical protein
VIFRVVGGAGFHLTRLSAAFRLTVLFPIIVFNRIIINPILNLDLIIIHSGLPVNDLKIDAVIQLAAKQKGRLVYGKKAVTTNSKSLTYDFPFRECTPIQTGIID